MSLSNLILVFFSAAGVRGLVDLKFLKLFMILGLFLLSSGWIRSLGMIFIERESRRAANFTVRSAEENQS